MPISHYIDVYDLNQVANVCNQILREVISLSTVSLAHVTMNPHADSLLHKHLNMDEIYYILNGEGFLHVGNRTILVQKGACVVIPKNTNHKLCNTSGHFLEHLVFASPPFNAKDVDLIDELNPIPKIKPSHEEFKFNKVPFTARDGATVYELLSKKEQERYGFELAFGILETGKKAHPHFHNISDEFYYVISGNGTAMIGDSTIEAIKNRLIYVPKNTVHGLDNSKSSEPLEVLCLSSPPYVESDFIVGENK